jgi:hypothetical protein
MMPITTPVTYYNGIAWHATTLPNGTRTQPVRGDGSGTLVARAGAGRDRAAAPKSRADLACGGGSHENAWVIVPAGAAASIIS